MSRAKAHFENQLFFKSIMLGSLQSSLSNKFIEKSIELNVNVLYGFMQYN